jgi:hypothetical protein
VFEELLVHRAEVRRRTGRTDRFGQPVDSNPSKLTDDDLVGTHPCRATRGKPGLTNEERSLDVFEALHTVFLKPGVDVREDDAVTVVDPVTGETVVPISKVKVKNVVYDGDGPHHIELVVMAQRGPG